MKKTMKYALLFLILLVASPVAAQVTDFESFTAGSVNYQGPGGTTVSPGGYTVPDPYGSLWTMADEWGNPPIPALDEGVMDDGTGNNVWRISNAVSTGGFSALPYSLSSPLAAGESTADLWNYRGEDHTSPFIPPQARATAGTPDFHASLRFKSATGTPQTDLAVSLSAGPRQGNIRQSYVSISDNGATGLDIGFYDTDAVGGFISATLATDLSYSDWHELDIYITFADGLNGDGSGNDVVSILLDGNPVHVGTTWETYYALNPGPFPSSPYAADALMFRPGSAQPGLSGGGLFFDDVLIDNEAVPATAVHNLNQDTYYAGLQLAIDDAVAGEVIQIEAPTITPTAQVIVDKNLTIQGLGSGSTTIAAGFNTTGGSYSTTSSMIYVDYGVTALIQDLTFDGTGFAVQQAVQSRGASVTVEDCVVSNIVASTYDGRGLVFLTGNGYVNNCTMSGIQRIGVHIRGGAIGEPAPYVEVDGLDYTGKGVGDYLDYGVEFGGGGQGSVNNATITACLGVATSDGSTSAGILVTDYYGTGTVATITGSTLTGNTSGMAVGYSETDMSQVTISGCDLSGNASYGISSTGPEVMAEDNTWGASSGPFHPGKNPGGLGMTVDDHVDFTPWTGRVTTAVADLGFGPSYPEMGTVGYGYAGSDPGIGVDGDFAPGFDPGCIQAPGTTWLKYGFLPEAVFGRDVNVGELYSITYHTKKDTDHVADTADWFLQMYTDPYDGSPGSTWYGNRLGSEPYFSDSLTEIPDEWTQWNTDAGENNRLRFFDSSTGYFGGYTDGFLDDLTGDPVYTEQPILYFYVGTGSGWAAGFDGLVDGLTIELVSGEIATVNFISGNTFVDAVPVATGPVACGTPVTLTFNLTTDEYTPDVFGYNAVVRAPAGVDFGTIASLDPFGGTTNFLKYDNSDGSWTISGTTTGAPTQPITGAGTHGLFTIVFTPTVEGDFDITYDLLQARDPDNVPIPVVGTGAMISVDCTAPAAVTGIIADPANKRINVGWTHDGTDVAVYEVYRGLWHDGTIGDSAYPEYDDVNPTLPVRPTDRDAAATPGGEWELAATVAVGTNTFADTWADQTDRGVYYYEVFPIDAATNAGPVAAANDRATNYWLGDVWGPVGNNPDPNGVVDVGDMDQLGAKFGLPVPTGDPINVLDVGPTDDWSRLGIPLTDDVINFEDLIVFAMNFGVVSAAKSQVPVGTAVDLVWVDYDNGTKALRLEGGRGLKGVRVTADANVSGVTAGTLLDEQSELTFLKNVGDKLDISVAVMGVNTTFEGTGDLFVVSTDSDITMAGLTITARAIDNSTMKVSLEAGSDAATPRVFALNGNYPNPFNPMTKISFSLPATHDVRLSVYSMDGRLVRTLLNETRGSGLHEIVWNGQDNAGRGVSSGTYFYRVDAGPYSDVKKMTLMK